MSIIVTKITTILVAVTTIWWLQFNRCRSETTKDMDQDDKTPIVESKSFHATTLGEWRRRIYFERLECWNQAITYEYIDNTKLINLVTIIWLSDHSVPFSKGNHQPESMDAKVYFVFSIYELLSQFVYKLKYD